MWPDQIFSMMRLGNILNQLNNQEQYDPEADMARLYQPQMTAQNQFTNMIGNFPQPQKVSNLRKIGATLAGLGSDTPFETAFQAANAPYLQQISNWQQQIGPMQQAADNERQSNIAQRQYANQVVTQRMNDRKQAEVERKNLALEQDKERMRNIQQQRANVYEYSRMNPNLVFNWAGPTVKFGNPTTGEVIDTGVETGNLSDSEKLAMQNHNRLQQIAAQGVQTQANQNNQAGNVSNQIAQRGEEARKTQAAKPVTANQPTTTTTTVKDAAGKTVGSREVVRAPGISPVSSHENRVRVKAPDGRTGTVTEEESKNLPKGWVIIK